MKTSHTATLRVHPTGKVTLHNHGASAFARLYRKRVHHAEHVVVDAVHHAEEQVVDRTPMMITGAVITALFAMATTIGLSFRGGL